MSQVPPVLNLTEDDLKLMLAAGVHIGSENLNALNSRYVFKRNEQGIHIINLQKTWEKLQLAARVLVAIENPKDIVAVGLSVAGAPPYSQRAIMKSTRYLGIRNIVGRYTPGTFTNQSQPTFFEPRCVIVSDPIKDHQPITEASYMNVPVIAFVNTNAPLRGIDIAIPCNTQGKLSVALMYYLLSREVLRLRDAVSREAPWEVMVDMFVYRDPEEAEKQEQQAKEQAEYNAQLGGEGEEWAEQGTAGDWAGESQADWDESAQTGNWGEEGEAAAAPEGGW